VLCIVALAEGQINETDCAVIPGRDIYWTGSNQSDIWSEADNWDEDALPKVTSVVHLDTDSSSELAPGTSFTISGLEIGAHHHFRVGPDNKLTVSYLEITCYGVYWCHGKGKCVDIDTCQCDPGFSGPSCDTRSENIIAQPLQDGMSLQFGTPQIVT